MALDLGNKTIGNSIHTLGLIENVDVSQIDSSKISIREDKDDISYLMQSIENRGLLQPIIVRILGNRFEIVAGNRRFLACKKIGWRKISCLVADLSDEESFEVALIENVQRRTMNPIEEANAYTLYIKDYGWGGVSDLAKRIGKSQEYVSKRLKLLELPKEIQEEIIRRRIKPSIAEELSYVKDEKEQSKLAKLIAQRHITMKKLREISANTADTIPVEDSSLMWKPQNNKNQIALFDKLIISLKLTTNRMNEIMENVGENFLIQELLLQQKNAINYQIDHVIKSKKKYFKLYQ